MRHSGARFGLSKQTFRPIPPVAVVNAYVSSGNLQPYYTYDGENWEAGSPIVLAGLSYQNSGAYGNNTYMLGTSYRSSDGITFERSNYSSSATGSNSREGMFFNPDDNLFHVVYGNAGSFYHQTCDGLGTWSTVQQISQNVSVYSDTLVCDFGYIAPLRNASSVNEIWASVDGTNFTSVYVLPTQNIQFGACWAGDRVLIATGGSTDNLIVGTAIDSWTQKTANFGNSTLDTRKLAYSPTLDIVVLFNGANIHYSADRGDTWTNVYTLPSGYKKVKWCSAINKFIGITRSSLNVYLSSDGINWTTVTGVFATGEPESLIVR